MKRRVRNLLVIGGLLVVMATVGVVFAIRAILSSGITSGLDNTFGDQHLKTAVALIELHKIRYGHYPRDFSELKFVGEWDNIALSRVSYRVNSDLTAYFVEVRQGWVGRPTFEMPAEFWRGTGYDPSLKRSSSK